MFGVTINEFYGQTECNLVVGNAASHLGFRAGSMGRAIPGHRVEVIDDRGNVVPAGTVGPIAIHRPDPVMFLGYWRNEAETARNLDLQQRLAATHDAGFAVRDVRVLDPRAAALSAPSTVIVRDGERIPCTPGEAVRVRLGDAIEIGDRIVTIGGYA